MSDDELQQAIDTARAFLAVPYTSYQQSLKEAQTNCVKHLEQLQKIQASRAALVTQPTITQGV
jgi:hypothetical protein